MEERLKIECPTCQAITYVSLKSGVDEAKVLKRAGESHSRSWGRDHGTPHVIGREQK